MGDLIEDDDGDEDGFDLELGELPDPDQADIEAVEHLELEALLDDDDLGELPEQETGPAARPGGVGKADSLLNDLELKDPRPALNPCRDRGSARPGRLGPG